MKIAVIVRSRNDIAYAKQTLSALQGQTFSDFKIFAFDNSSTDGTRQVYENAGNIEIIDIPEGAYIPGKILNMAVSHTKADVYVFNNLDAIPQNSRWLENLIAPILQGKADITYARQLPRPDAKLWVKCDYANAFPAEKSVSDIFFSMASSAVSAKVFNSINFDDTLNFSEDVMFVKTARENNYKVAYVPTAEVEHSHNYNKESLIRRFKGEGVADRKILGAGFTRVDMLRRIVVDVLRDVKFAFKTGKFIEIPSCLYVRCLQKKAYYLGRKGVK